MKRKIAIIALALALVLSMSVMLFACDSGSQSGGKEPSGKDPSQGFVNPGDNLGGGGEGVLPDDTDSVQDDIESKDFSDLQSNTSADGIVINGSEEAYEIKAAGTYVLGGDFKNGIVVKVGDKETTRLVLNGANIVNENGISLSNTNKKSSLIITLQEGTQNTISNSTDGNAIHVKGSLSINGKGSLSVTSGAKSAIKVSKGFEMVDANVTLSSANHGLSARFVEIHNATLNVSAAAKDGINAECDDETTAFTNEEGYVILKSVNYTCSVEGDGIQADTFCKIDGGNINITTNGKFVSYSSANMKEYDLDKDDYRYLYQNGDYQKVASDDRFVTSKAYALAQSCKGIKVGEIKYDELDEDENVIGEIVVTDGDYLISITGDCTMTINSADDAIHTNSGDVLVENGNITINTYDDGITSDGLTEIRGGKIDILKSYEGIEGAYVKISGGEIYIIASDDGINAATDDNSIKEYIIISGGNIIVNADGDGVDSNGSIFVSGGSLIVYGPTSGMDAALDADSGIIINGGVVWACSTLGMVETPSTNSEQYVVSYAQQNKLEEGSVFTLKDSDGTALLSVDVAKTCQSIIFSTDKLEKGATYTIYCNDTLMSTFTVSSTLTTIGTAQNAGPGGGGFDHGGGFGPGGKPGGWWR